jgi:hypothetical protein
MEAEMAEIKWTETKDGQRKAKAEPKRSSLADILLDTMAAGANAVELCVPIEKPVPADAKKETDDE